MHNNIQIMRTNIQRYSTVQNWNRFGEAMATTHDMTTFEYSGTPLIRPPTGHKNLVVLTGWSY